MAVSEHVLVILFYLIFQTAQGHTNEFKNAQCGC